MIEVSSLTKRFGSFTALNGLSFQVSKGSVTGFLGLNGAGKTTTLRVISCFLPPTAGAVRICGFDTVRQSLEVRKRIGYLPEAVPLYPELRVGEYLRFRARLKGVGAREAAKAVGEAARRCRVDDVIRRPIGTLSKGYRQRVGFADAIVHGPEVLVLDEPTSGLDPTQRIQVRELVREVGSERTVFVSTHIIPEVEATCEKVVVIHKGRIVANEPLSAMSGSRGFRIRWRGAPRRGATLEDGVHLLREADQAAASAIAAELVRGGAELLELAPERESLESLFTRLTSGSDA